MKEAIMVFTSQLRHTLFVCLLPLGFIACNSGSGNTETSGLATSEDFTRVLADTVGKVIVPTYESLRDEATELATCVDKLAENPTEAQLTACQTAWIAARVPWEQSEGFLFGPVTDQGLDPAMDSWPVDHEQLDALMDSNVELSADTITANLGGGMKGFHTVEYLLWGMNHERTAEDLANAPREIEYLVALTQALAFDTQTLVDAWTGSDESAGYGVGFAKAGTSEGLYGSQLDAVQELIGGMIGICDEVAYGKIAEPFKERDPNLIESQFSYNSLLDFADNIRSIQNVYQGSLDMSVGKNSLSAVVARYDASLDEAVREQIATAVEAIEAIGEDGLSFRDAILDSKYDAVIERAQDEIASLMELLGGSVLPLFSR